MAKCPGWLMELRTESTSEHHILRERLAQGTHWSPPVVGHDWATARWRNRIRRIGASKKDRSEMTQTAITMADYVSSRNLTMRSLMGFCMTLAGQESP